MRRSPQPDDIGPPPKFYGTRDNLRERFGVDYTLPGADLLLHRIGWSVQVPARRAAERDEEQIAAWREETWPEIKRPRRTWAPGWSSRTSPARG
jgi:hypothetical protein